MLHIRSKAGWELFSPCSWMHLSMKKIVFNWIATHRKAQARTYLSCGLFVCGKKPFFSLLLSDSWDGLRRKKFSDYWANNWIQPCRLKWSLLYLRYLFRRNSLVFLFQKSTLGWIKLSADCSEQCDTLLIASEPNMIKVLFTHFTYSPFPAWAWWHPVDDVMCISPCHMFWSWNMTCYVPLFSGVQGREDEAPAISMCDFWWSAPRYFSSSLSGLLGFFIKFQYCSLTS